MGFPLTAKDRDALSPINPTLRRVVERAAQLSTQVFTVHEGLRSVARQQQLVAQGLSKTMNSKHLTGNAVDLVPVSGGKLVWDASLVYSIAFAMRQAAIEQGTPLTWGAVWDRRLNALGTNLQAEINAYKSRKSNAFIDMVHFEYPFEGFVATTGTTTTQGVALGAAFLAAASFFFYAATRSRR